MKHTNDAQALDFSIKLNIYWAPITDWYLPLIIDKAVAVGLRWNLGFRVQILFLTSFILQVIC